MEIWPRWSRISAAPQIFLTGRRRAFSFSEDMAGVSTISITGPYGVVYAQQFTPPVKSTGLAVYDLPAGPYYIRSYNSVGGLSVSMRLSVDGTPPVTTAALNGAELVLLAMDPVSNGLSSKVQSVFYALDAIPAGSRAAGIYTKPVELPPGKHMVYFFSMDKVGNMETVNSLPVNVPPHASKRK